ncbi:MAG: DUF4157 domain-containing protein [Coleofasciculus sp. C1-SOL-03]
MVHRQIDPRVQMRQMIQQANQIDGNQASGDLESRLNASKGGGSPLSENVRGFMEPRFGADFSGVRVHTGGEAVQMNQELGAQAFTHGSDVYFGAGKSPGNNELTAHELTHVVQQTGAVQQQNQPLQNQSISLKEIPILEGVAPKSNVLSHLQSLRGTASHDSSVYRKEILQFQRENPADKIAASQQQVLESDESVDIQQKDTSSQIRRCGGNSTPSQTSAEKVEFTGSHALTAYGSDPKANATWTPSSTDHAVAYTKSTNPVINAQFKLGKDLSGSSVPASASVRVKEGGAIRGTKTGIAPSGGIIDVAGLTLTGLTDSTEVRSSTYNLEWEGSADGTTWTPIGTTGAHPIYWVHNTPLASPLYNFAVAQATGYAAGASDVAAAIRSGLHGSIAYNPADPINADPLTVFNDGVGICTDFGNLLTLLARSVGLNANAVMFWGGFQSLGKNVWVTLGGSYTNLVHVNPGDWSFNYHVISRIEGTLQDAALDRVGIDAQAVHDGKIVHLVELNSAGLPEAKKGQAYNQVIPRKDHTVQVTIRDYDSQITSTDFNDVYPVQVPSGAPSPVEVPVMWSLASGSLPTGLSLNPATGVISGTPTADGMFTLGINVNAGSGFAHTSSLNLEVKK